MNFTFDEWFSDVKEIAKEYGYIVEDSSKEAWQPFYEDGYSPREAFLEDLTNG